MASIKIGGASPARSRKPLKPSVVTPSIFDQLLPFKWREVEVPTTRVRTSIAQDLVQHKPFNVAGDEVENTGRGSWEIEAEIPFINGIAAGKNESWDKEGSLYPDVYRRFLYAWFDGTTGPLQHPEFGIIHCKTHRIDFDHDGGTRNGVFVRASWVETRDQSGDDLADLIQIKGSPIAMVKQAAIDLDIATRDIRAQFDQYLPPQFEESFDSAVAKIAGNFDRLTTSIQLAANKPAQIRARLGQLERSVNGLRSAATWPVTDAIARMRDGLHALENAGVPGRQIGRHKTTESTSLARLAKQFGNKPGEIVSLNPSLISRPEVPAGAIVRYYL